MEFKIVNASRTAPILGAWVAYLIEDRWDDWAKFRTQFYLVVFDEEGQKFDIGNVKLGQAGLLPAERISPGHRAPELPQSFSDLNSDFFSLGQDETYYETLRSLPGEIGVKILVAIRDCAYDLNIFFRTRKRR